MSELTRVPRREDCVLRDLLHRYAEETPEKSFVVYEKGGETSYRTLLEQVRSIAKALQDLGVRQDDRVLVWLPNGPDSLRVWFAINYIGAVYVPINTAYRGGILEHVIRNAGARLLVAHAQLVPRLGDCDTALVERVVVLGGTAEPLDRLEILTAEHLEGRGAPAEPPRPVEPWDTQSIIYTSGTTGPSKGVLSSYAHLHAMSGNLISDREGGALADGSDRFMVNLPMFHVGGTAPTYSMLVVGGSIAMLEGFDTASFWETVESTQSTYVILLGVMTSFLVKQPEREGERKTCLRHALIIPLAEEGIAFRKRFGVRTHTLFNMSEVSCPLISDIDPEVAATCGSPRRGVQARLVDANDCEVPRGAVGELVLRTDRPWALNHGYNANPEATAQAWRNGWFHTGDAFRIDGAGNYFFVDRFKDSIRRRGENVSSFEVEREVCLHPAVREAAAVAVPSEYGEDEILVAVSPAEGQALDPADLLEFLLPRMAHFMVPRYLRILDDLPKTPTRKVEKYLIRRAGITEDTWDREAAGIKVRREKLG